MLLRRSSCHKHARRSHARLERGTTRINAHALGERGYGPVVSSPGLFHFIRLPASRRARDVRPGTFPLRSVCSAAKRPGKSVGSAAGHSPNVALRQHVAHNVQLKTHRVADVTAGSNEKKGLSIVNHDNSNGSTETGATPETTRWETPVVPA